MSAFGSEADIHRIAQKGAQEWPLRSPTRYPVIAESKKVTRMYIAMNRFKIVKGEEDAFEEVWRTRERHLDSALGYKNFKLLRGPEREDHTLYASHTVWESEQHFTEWTKSEAFRAAHRNAGGNRTLYLGHPEFEGFTVVLDSDDSASAEPAHKG